MKPIKLKIKGLNSFIEEQIIDFEELTDRGFFGIFGPTGSGKSTILDGITLALYGDVARKSSNYINTNCERLNVSFEFQISGKEVKRYLVDREFKRKKDSGNQISGKCKIVDITEEEEEEVLADKVGTVTKKVEEIIGLNLDDFTRTVVLPQGKFSEFLKLEGKDRRAMLERLFNLQKYGDNLSKKLSSQINKERTENNILKGQLIGYEDIDEKIFKEKKHELKDLNKNIIDSNNELKQITIDYKNSEELWNLQLELEGYQNEEKKLKEKEEEINKDIEKIKLGESASKVIPYINFYENTVKEFDDYKLELEKINEGLNEIKKEKDFIEKTWNEAKDNKESKLPNLILKEQKIIDSIEEKKLLDNIQICIKNLNIEIRNHQNRSEEIQSKLKNLDEERKFKINVIKDSEKSYEELKIDEKIKEKIQQGMIKSDRYNNLNLIITKDEKKKLSIEKDNEQTIIDGKKLKDKIEEKNIELKENKKLLENLIKNCPGEQKDLLKLQQQLVENKEKWNRYDKANKEIKLNEYEINALNNEISKNMDEAKKMESDLENLKIHHNQIIKEHLAYKLREELKDGEICPVCGSIHHLKENLKVNESIDIKTIEKDIKDKENSLKIISQEITRNETKVSNLKEKVLSKEEDIQQLGIDFKESSVEALTEKFEQLKNSLEGYIKEKEQLEKRINELENEINIEDGKINELRAVVKTNNKQLKELQKDIEDNSKELILIQQELIHLKEETLVDDFKQKNDEIKEVEKQREKLSSNIKINREELEKLSEQIDSLNKEYNSIKEKLAKDNADLLGYEKNKEEKIQLIKSKVGEENNLTELLTKVQRDIEFIKENFEILEKKKTSIEKDFAESNEKLISTISKYEETNKRKDDDKKNLDISISSEGFENLEQVKKNIISQNEIDSCKKRLDSYKENISKINGAIESLIKKIDGRELTKEQWNLIGDLKLEKEGQLKEINEEQIKLQQELKNMKTKIDELKELLEKKKKIDYKLSLLNDLEKLFKGKRFVEFVAINQLKYISIEASKRLKEITHGIYGLEVDEDSKFIIRDYKNGGAERDASTLSGGETFLASLSLALALSAQIQLKGTAPLELFFLDEGFGTLDEDLLEVVMSSLEKIHNDKLKVGIISHVEEIKNRVPVKLIVTPAECGISGSKVKIERS